MSATGKRIRDPVHGLIVFRNTPVDQLALRLIDTPEFQRLRRIRQLGVSEFTFPGAVHTRFAHSIGVFHTARQLVEIIRREVDNDFDENLAEIAQISALLHDIGHGPFSHTFEGVQKLRGATKRHEQWTAEIIRNPHGNIRTILNSHRPDFAEDVAALLEKEDPENIYHAVVSSSFDADRLDYLRRDRLMTGTGAGAIDFDWLIDNLRVAEIDIDIPDEGDDLPRRVPTFCLAAKALPAAEQFLLARYTLHEQVYFHKATRCVESMVGRLLKCLSELTLTKGGIKACGISRDHPLVRFFCKGGETVENYLALDDQCILGALSALRCASDAVISELAGRLQDRRLYKTLDLTEFGSDAGKQRLHIRRIKESFRDKIESGSVIVDDGAGIGIYSEIGGDEERMHKKLYVLDGTEPKEISALSKLIEALSPKKSLTRVYFADPADRNAARGKGNKDGR